MNLLNNLKEKAGKEVFQLKGEYRKMSKYHKTIVSVLIPLSLSLIVAGGMLGRDTDSRNFLKTIAYTVSTTWVAPYSLYGVARLTERRRVYSQIESRKENLA